MLHPKLKLKKDKDIDGRSDEILIKPGVYGNVSLLSVR